MSVGWLKVRRTYYETFWETKNYATYVIYYFGISRLLILACLFWARRSLDYRKTPWCYNLGQNHQKWNSNLQPPNHGWHRGKAKMHHFAILVWRGGRKNFPSISYKHRRQPGGILNINYSRLRDEIPALGNSVPRTLVKAKPRWQTSEGQRDL